MKQYSALFLFLFIPQAILAQITIKEDISTDSIDLTLQTEESSKSTKLALAAAILLPAASQQYLGKPNAAMTYLSVDMFALVGAVFCERYSGRLSDDSRGFAGQYAGANASRKSGTYWENVGNFESVEAYNEAVRLDRIGSEKIYNDESQFWYWEDSTFQNEYVKMRKRAQKFHLASSFCIGAMVLNRIVSFVHVRSLTRYKGVKGLSYINITPTFSSNLSSAGVILSAQF